MELPLLIRWQLLDFLTIMKVHEVRVSRASGRMTVKNTLLFGPKMAVPLVLRLSVGPEQSR